MTAPKQQPASRAPGLAAFPPGYPRTARAPSGNTRAGLTPAPAVIRPTRKLEPQ
jgi:hypothetical protein